MKVKQITETTTAGSIATVESPLGGTQRRAGSMFRGKKTNKPFYEDGTEVAGLVPAGKVGKARKKGPYANSIVEGKMKELSQDLKELSDTEFKKKYGQTKAEWRASLKNNKAKIDESKQVRESSESAIDRIRDRIGTAGKLQNLINRHEDYMNAHNQMALSRMSDEERYNAAKTQHLIDRLKKDSEDWEKTFDMLRDRINRYQWTTQQSVDPENVEKISNIKYQPTKEGIGGAVDSKGRTQQEWIKAVKQKFPDAKIIQSKMIDGPVHALLPNNKKLSWTKDGSQDIAEGKIDEAEITEQDLIVVPGMRRMKDKSFVSHKEDRRDHEVEMARSDLYATAKNAMRIFELLKDRSEEEGLMGWQQSYITLAADYLNSVADSIEYNAKVKGELDEMTGGVIAGGMSNFEEDAVNELSPATKKSYAAQAKQDKEFNQRGIDQALSRAAADQHPGSAEWEDEAEFLKRVNAKRDRGLARAGVSEGSNELDQQARAVADKLTTGKNLEKLRGKVYDSTVYRALDRYFEKHNIPETIYNRVAQIVFQRINQQGVEEAEKQGLWANIHAKRERIKHGSGERMRKPGSKGAPTKQAFKQSQATSKK